MLDDTLREIKRDCTAAMNGVISQSMRDYGLDYKLNFGLRALQIKALADKYGKSAELAERLWTEKTRELLILATLIYPSEEFERATALQWGKDIKNQEIREQVTMNLFQHLTFAKDLAFQWIKESDIELKITGYWLLQRLLLSKKLNTSMLYIDLPQSFLLDIISDNLFLRNASSLVGKHYVRQNEDQAKELLLLLNVYKNNEDKLRAEAYNAIAFESQFLWGHF